MSNAQIQTETVLQHLEKMLASATFQNGGRAGALLRFVVERTLGGRGEELKEYTLGADALGRGEAFDPRIDSIARVEASRLRSRLELYYATEGAQDGIRIVLAKGSYQPRFEAAAARAVPRDSYWKGVALAACALTVVALWAPWRSTETATRPVTRVEVDLGPQVSLRSTQVGSSSVILSPDGRRLVFVSFRADGVPRLMMRRLDQTDSAGSVEIPGTDGARGPFFSPHGDWIAFQSGQRLLKIPVEGGAPVAMCETPELLGGSWADDGTIIASLGAGGLWRVHPDGGCERLPGFPPAVTAFWPMVLPGSKSVLFATGGTTPVGISAFSLVDHKVKLLIAGGAYPRLLASGHLAFIEQRSLMVAPFDPARVELTGPKVTMLNDVSVVPGFETAEADVSASGALVYRRDATRGGSVVRWLTAHGAETALVSEPGRYGWPRLSPDGTKLALTSGDRVLQVHEWSTGRTTHVAENEVFAGSAVWTPDSELLVTPSPQGGMQWTRADGAGSPHVLLASGKLAQIPWSFNPAGDRLAYYQRGADADGPITFDLWTVPVHRDGDTLTAGTPEPFVVSDVFETYPMFSPNGQWIAYTSLESSAYEVYVRAYPDDGRKWLVSSGGGADARWAGNRLFYRSRRGSQQVMVVDYTVRSGEFVAGVPRVWSEVPLADNGVLPNFDVTQDGRVVALLPGAAAGDPQDEHHVTLVVDFLDEVRRRTAK